MKIIVSFFLILLIACTSQPTETKKETVESLQSVEASFAQILDSADFAGSILVYDSKNNQYTSNDFKWAETGQLPASTFKIPNSLIALELGIISSDTSTLIWDGEKRWNDHWNQDLTFKQAFYYSCLPCYQKIARKVGVKRMQKMIDSFQYVKVKVDSTNLDNFWLMGDTRINCFQQIDFLQRFYNQELPITPSSYTKMKSVMVRDTLGEAILSGKTGWSSTDTSDNGWFVGYVETSDNVYYFATNVSPLGHRDSTEYFEARIQVTLEALRKIGAIK